MKIIIAQFAKAPIPGQVKTRLTPGIDTQQACRLHEFLVRTVMHDIQTFIAEDTSELALQHELWCSQQHEFFNQLSGEAGISVKYQQGHDLGKRLLNCLDVSLYAADAVILVGSDCPFFSNSYLQDACATLSKPSIDVVIGPAEDGGYVLLGLKQYCPAIFQDIHWSTDQVFSQTLEKIRQQQLVSYVLPSLSDVDRPEDLPALFETHPQLASIFPAR